MGYLTQTDIINNKIVSDSGRIQSAFIDDVIKRDETSKYKKDMNDSVNYYDCEHNINEREITYIVDKVKIVDLNKPNNKIVNPYHKLLVDQKVSYIAGNPIVVTADKKEDQAIIDTVTGDDFNDLLIQWLTGSSLKGQEWLHYYLDSEGKFQFIIIPAEQIIVVYDSQYQKEIVYIIRYYIYELIDDQGNSKALHKVEWWDKEKAEFWKEIKEGVYILDDDYTPNPRPHYVEVSTDKEGEKISYVGFGRVPFIPLYNNDRMTTDLKPIKPLIDILDLIYSDWANLIQMLPNAVIKLVGYGKDDLDEFLYNLKNLGVVAVEEGGDVDTLRIEIPVEALDKFITLTKKQIFVYGQGVDTTTEDISAAPSGVALKFLYASLDLKANAIIRKLKKALNEFFSCVFENNNKEMPKLTYTINKSLIINELEKVDMLVKSENMLSEETILKNHPLVDDPVEEQKRKDKDRDKMVEQDMVDLNKAMDDEVDE